MKDSTTGKDVVVEIDTEFGPYVQLSEFEDYDFLEDELAEKFGIEPFAIKPIKENENIIAHRIYFGKSANPKSMQKLVNQIEYKNS